MGKVCGMWYVKQSLKTVSSYKKKGAPVYDVYDVNTKVARAVIHSG